MLKARAIRAYRTSTVALAGQHGRKPIQNPVCGVLPIVTTRHRRDIDNVMASLKSALDGLTDNGWWKDDAEIQALTIRRPVYIKDWPDSQIVIVADEASNEDHMLRKIIEFSTRCRDDHKAAWQQLKALEDNV